MSFTTLLYILASLALSPLVSARGGGRGGGGGGSSTSSSSSANATPSVCTEVLIFGLCIKKIWIIIPSVILGLVILGLVLCLCKRYGCCGCFGCFGWIRRKSAPSHAYLKAEALRMQAAARDEEWGNTWQQHYARPHSEQASRQTLPYAQGGLGYNDNEQMVYLPPTINPASYSALPYHQQQHTGSQSTMHSTTHLQPFAPARSGWF